MMDFIEYATGGDLKMDDKSLDSIIVQNQSQITKFAKVYLNETGKTIRNPATYIEILLPGRDPNRALLDMAMRGLVIVKHRIDGVIAHYDNKAA